jgi:hypothetical protein
MFLLVASDPASALANSPAVIGGYAYYVVAASSFSQVEAVSAKLSNKIASAERSINNQISTAADKLDRRIKNDDKSILDQLKRNAAANKEGTKRLAQQIRDLMVEAGAAEEKMRAERMFGKVWRMDNACSDPAAAEGLQVGKKAESKVSKESYQMLKEHNEHGYSSSGPNSFTAKLRDMKDEDIDAAILFPEGGVMGAEDIAKAQRISEVVTNPAPTPELPDRMKNSPEGQAYEAQKKIKAGRLTVPQKVWSDFLAANSATVPLDGWAQDTYERMGGSGTPEGVKDGKMSPMSALDMQVDMRYANPNWAPDVFGASEENKLYEIAQMQAVNLEFQRRQHALLQQIALMLAQDQSARVNQEQDPIIRARYNQVLSKGTN